MDAAVPGKNAAQLLVDKVATRLLQAHVLDQRSEREKNGSVYEGEIAKLEKEEMRG
jgi:hypothetical protein